VRRRPPQTESPAWGDLALLPTTILIDGAPKCVVRANDMKGLLRFIRNGKAFLLAEKPDADVSHRMADEAEVKIWNEAMALHKAWGGDDEDFFGVPFQQPPA